MLYQMMGSNKLLRHGKSKVRFSAVEVLLKSNWWKEKKNKFQEECNFYRLTNSFYCCNYKIIQTANIRLRVFMDNILTENVLPPPVELERLVSRN